MSEARIVSSTKLFSPITIDEFISHWHDKNTTDLQRDQLEKEIIGKTIIWTGTITSIRPDRNDTVMVVVKPADLPSSFALALLHFDSSQQALFLNLGEGQLIRFTCVAEKVYSGDPFLEKCRILRVVK